MTNDQAIKDFEVNITEIMKKLSPSELRAGVRLSLPEISERARQIAIAALRSKNFHVEGNKADWEKGIRVHVYSGGGGFLVTVRGRHEGGEEKGFHENRYYGKIKRRLPILQWQEYGTKERKTRGTRKRGKVRYTGVIRPSHFLTSSEPQMVKFVNDALKKAVENEMAKISKNK